MNSPLEKGLQLPCLSKSARTYLQSVKGLTINFYKLSTFFKLTLSKSFHTLFYQVLSRLVFSLQMVSGLPTLNLFFMTIPQAIFQHVSIFNDFISSSVSLVSNFLRIIICKNLLVSTNSGVFGEIALNKKIESGHKDFFRFEVISIRNVSWFL